MNEEQSRAVDVVVSDMAPNMSGMDVIDPPKSANPGDWRSICPQRVLKQHRNALIKVLQGAGFQEPVKAARSQFICR